PDLGPPMGDPNLETNPPKSRETVLFGGPDSDQSSTIEPTKTDIAVMSKEQPTSSVSGVPVEDPAPGLHDVVVDAVPLQELGTEDYGNTKDAFLVDLAVLEAGVTQ
ncbi:hypothetical protein PENVUL_c149G07310, partial [Penicillium vulpinum]